MCCFTKHWLLIVVTWTRRLLAPISFSCHGQPTWSFVCISQFWALYSVISSATTKFVAFSVQSGKRCRIVTRTWCFVQVGRWTTRSSLILFKDICIVAFTTLAWTFVSNIRHIFFHKSWNYSLGLSNMLALLCRFLFYLHCSVSGFSD